MKKNTLIFRIALLAVLLPVGGLLIQEYMASDSETVRLEEFAGYMALAIVLVFAVPVWRKLRQQKLQAIDFNGQISAISKSQAVIEFNMDGTIIRANDNFLNTVGYALEEIQGKHHMMFVDPAEAAGQNYKDFWASLNRGEYQTAEYKRFGKGGREVWIQASYNPILDARGKPFKVVKYATETTAAKMQTTNFEGQIDAIGKSQAVISFNMDGTIIEANQNFLSAVGYTLEEIQGKHHMMFVDPAEAAGQDYKEFWASLNRGEYQAAEYKRFGKGGREFWIQASYNPILDLNGKPFKVVKYATETTAAKLQNADVSGQLDAISKSQAVISFNMDGTIIDANDNFLGAVGYSREEIHGKHHSIFMDPTKVDDVYREFWAALNRGEYQSAEYRRIAKGGREIWIQASYNPIFDQNGKPFKVVKYATDITKQKLAIQKINTLIAGATKGELNDRIDADEFTGFYRELTGNMNGLLDSIALPVTKAVELLEAFSHGDLTQTMEGYYQGSFANMQASLNNTLQVIGNMVRRLTDTAGSVNTAANEIATGSSDLSMRTEQQASSLEETAASMEELTRTVRQNAQHANEANTLSTNASTIADAGGTLVGEAITAMTSIEQSSQKISDIIGVIDEIAFQTNLLALNAAVEAARAGDAGKGFAVVASEVRALAGRSATASKEIKTLISESAAQVKTGAGLVKQSGDTLRNIVGSVKQVANIVGNIAGASAQQANGIGEINAAVSQMDEMTQQNAALVEENTAAAQSMVEQAKALESLIAFFRLDGTVHGASDDYELFDTPVAPKVQARPAPAPVKRATASSTLSAAAQEQGWEEF